MPDVDDCHPAVLEWLNQRAGHPPFYPCRAEMPAEDYFVLQWLLTSNGGQGQKETQ